MGSGSAVDCEPLGNFCLNATEGARLQEVEQEKNQGRMLLDLGSSDEEVCLVKASYVPQMESDKEQKKQEDTRLKIERLEATIEGLTSSKGFFEVEAHVNKEKCSELKKQIIQMRSLLEPIQMKVLKQTKMLETNSEKLLAMEQAVKVLKDEPQIKDCQDLGKDCEGVNEMRLRNKELEASLVQMTGELNIKSSEMERSRREINRSSCLIQKLEKDLVVAKLMKHKDMLQHNSVVVAKDKHINNMSEEIGKRENQLTQAQEECSVHIKECEELQMKLNREMKSTEKLKADMIDADLRLALAMVKRNDLEKKVEGMLKKVEDLEVKITKKDIDLVHQIDLLVNMTKENLVKDGKITEYCKAKYSLLQEVKLKTKEVEELTAIMGNARNKLQCCQKVDIALAEAEVKLVEKSVEVQTIQEKLEEKEAEFSLLLMLKSKSLKRQSEDVLEENSKTPRLSGDNNLGTHSLGAESSLPVPFPKIPCLPTYQTPLPVRPSPTVEFDDTPRSTPISPYSPDPTSSQSLSQTAPRTKTAVSQPRVQPSFLRVRDITTLLDQELQASLAEKEELARIRLKHEVAENVKLYLQPYQQQKDQSAGPLDYKIWKISSNEDFVEVCRSQCLLSREEILEEWRQTFSSNEDLKITDKDIVRIQEKIHFFFTVRKEVSQELEKQLPAWDSNFLPQLHRAAAKLFQEFLETHRTLSPRSQLSLTEDMMLAIRGHLGRGYRL